jgi:hypothetical protein
MMLTARTYSILTCYIGLAFRRPNYTNRLSLYDHELMRSAKFTMVCDSLISALFVEYALVLVRAFDHGIGRLVVCADVSVSRPVYRPCRRQPTEIAAEIRGLEHLDAQIGLDLANDFCGIVRLEVRVLP